MKHNYLPKKEAHVLPSPEDMDMKPWAFTLNCGTNEYAFELFERYLSAFKELAKVCYVCMRPEFSSKMKLHYHGTIQLRKYSEIFKLFVILNDLKQNYTFCLKPIIDYEWYLYCIKQRHIMKWYCRDMKKPYKVTNEFYAKKTLEGFFGATLKDDFKSALDY